MVWGMCGLRGLRQAPQPTVDMDDRTAGVGAAGAGAAEAAAAEADYLGGLYPSLANLTSCVWSLQLDRAAVVRAVRGRLQQGGTSGGDGAGDSSSGSRCLRYPLDVSYVLLQSVQLVVPERELLLLAWAWATNATHHAAHPGLVEQLQLMLYSSRLAGGAGAVQQLLQGPSDSPGGSAPTLPAGLRLVFDQFVWCGLLGTNVTLTSQLPGPTRLVLQLPDLDLPVSFGTGPDDEVEWTPGAPQHGEAAASGVTGGAPVVLVVGPPPSRGAGPGDLEAAPGAPAAVGPGVWQGPIGAAPGPALPPESGNGSVQQPGMATAGGGGEGGGRGALPHPLGLAVGLAVGCTAVLLGTCVVVVLLAQRKRAARARYKWGVELIVCGVAGAGGCSGSPGERDRANGGGRVGADGDARSEQQQESGPTALSHEQPRAPRVGHASSYRVPQWVLRQITALRLNIEAERQLVLGQVQVQQQQATPHRGPSGTGREPRPLASAAPVPMHLQQRVSGGADQLGGGQLRRRSTTIDGGTASGSAATLPSKNEAGGSLSVSLSLDLTAAPSGGGSGTGKTAATETASGLYMGALAGVEATAGSGNGGTAGGNGHSNSSSTSSGGPPLVLLRELGRGAQGVVYAGRWRGLDVAVKSVLVQRLGGLPTGGLWHGPSLHSALSEGSISSAMSHPHVVATYAAYVQGPEGEEQVVVGEHEGQRGAAGTAVRSSPGGRYSNLLHQQSAAAASALETIVSEGALELHGDGKRECREDVAATELKDEGCEGKAAPSAPAAGVPASPTPETAQGPEQQPLRTTHPLLTEPPSGLACPPSGQDYTRSAGIQWQGVAGVPGTPQVQVWKLTLVQELCTGGSLRDSLLAGRLARRGSGPWPRALHPAAALRLVLHVACGSAHLHRHGVLWNDLSSANVLLQLGRRGWETREAPGANSSGGDDSVDFVAKVADFGLSRRLPEGATHASETAGRSGLYVAPEVVRYGRCTPASDVYAYGVLLWEVAAGVPLPELLSQPEGGHVRSWLAQQAFVPPEEVEALPAELLGWPGTGQHTGGKALTGHGSWGGTNVDGDGACLLPAGYVALAEQCLQEDPRQRPTFDDACWRLERMIHDMGAT